MLTLRELKNMAETALPKQKMPTVRELRLSGKLIAEKEVGGCAGIAACQNGYAVYHAGRDATVFRIHACSGYSYDSCSSPCPSDIGSGTFDGEAWYLRLVLEGEDRLSRNLASREQDWNVSYSAVSEEWGALDSGTEGALDRIISEETVERLLSVPVRKAAAGSRPVLPRAENRAAGCGGTWHYGFSCFKDTCEVA